MKYEKIRETMSLQLDDFFEKNLNRYKMGQIWTKWAKIDRDRFLSVSGPRICQNLQKNHEKNNKNNGFLDFGWILGDNHGFGKPWFLAPSISATRVSAARVALLIGDG